MEELVVVAAAALLLFLSMPAIRTLFDQMHTPSGVQATISSALATAKAIAAREQKYAGIRFQHAYDTANPLKSPLTQPQYIIFIIYDGEIGNGVQGNLGCRAVEGFEPIELPKHVGVMDLMINQNQVVDTDGEISSDTDLLDTTTFTILFSPSGKLIVHGLWVRNRDNGSATSNDDVFNTQINVGNGIAMFLHDGEIAALNIEPSRRSFIIYDRNEFKGINSGSRWTNYLQDIEPVYINPYTGTIIDR